MNVPCEDCVYDKQEISSMLTPTEDLFKRGWHVHKVSGNVTGTALRQEYVTFLDTELWDTTVGKLYEA